MAEWLKAVVLKTIERKFRGFESLLLRMKSERSEGFKRRQEGFEVRSRSGPQGYPSFSEKNILYIFFVF